MLKGQIILWWGSLATIPAGWQHCDGTNGTPDLKNKFIRGAITEVTVGVTGGLVNHSHDFTADGHRHTGIPGGAVEFCVDNPFLRLENISVTGTTDTQDGRPPFHTLAYIMKMFDDPDLMPTLPWPYAAKAICQHTHQADVLQVWITFRFKMNQDNKPADGLWLIECDGVPEAITASAWQDPWTMLLTIDPLIGAPAEVTVEYDGPSPLLATVWDKQWEPWAPIPSVEIPTPPETKTFSTGPAAQDDVNVSGISILFLDCSANDITIGGFVGGKNGQVLTIAKICAAANDVTLEHNEGGGEQDIFLHAGGDETLTGEYGGWVLACNGTNWYDVSHAKHV